ncbi:MAG: 3-deoxy-manno-octulosonate cytidylyltransferase [Desulfovibrio sp.]|jgi:3-deoxy-manno-octulosonate cytidylyltransferase (CMP-KDO synthetase)|nr:3-deoxy-manno-octulosonate cytidylyltransferase [Desulfovibrio sp.]
MNALPKCYGIIPARYASSRFPGKPLVEILGKPMFWHVFQRAQACPAMTRVVLATDDERIRAKAEELDVPVLMTRPDHASGTDRVLEAAERLGVEPDAVVVNIQGDEPCLDPDMLSELTAPFRHAHVRVTTLAAGMDAAQAASPDRVKVALAANGDALYFSRAAIPYNRDGADGDYLLHIGLYGFRMEALRAFAALPQGRLEQRERLEQLRFLENNIPIRVSLTRHRCHGVDREEDLTGVTNILREQA